MASSSAGGDAGAGQASGTNTDSSNTLDNGSLTDSGSTGDAIRLIKCSNKVKKSSLEKPSCFNANNVVKAKLKVVENLSCIYFNARSIVNKRDELALYLNEEDVDIIGITETWLNSSISDSEVAIEGYNLYRKDRCSDVKSRGGGVALYIGNDLTAVCCEEIADDRYKECIFCSVESNNKKTIVGVCYRPPNSTNLEDEGLYTVITKASSHQCVILGDFNYSELKWNSTLED